jgi:hypothetical protein
MAVDSTMRQRTTGAAQASKFVVTEEGKAADKRLDNHETYVFFSSYYILSKSSFRV